MEKASAIFHNGQVELDQPVDWPDGTKLEIYPAGEKTPPQPDDSPPSAEELAAWDEWFKTVPPFDMTPEELDAFEAELKANKEAQKELMRRRWAKEDHH